MYGPKINLRVVRLMSVLVSVSVQGGQRCSEIPLVHGRDNFAFDSVEGYEPVRFGSDSTCDRYRLSIVVGMIWPLRVGHHEFVHGQTRGNSVVAVRDRGTDPSVCFVGFLRLPYAD